MEWKRFQRMFEGFYGGEMKYEEGRQEGRQLRASISMNSLVEDYEDWMDWNVYEGRREETYVRQVREICALHSERVTRTTCCEDNGE